MKKILVIQTASIGDVILATALLEKLHCFYPDTQLDLLVRKGMESLFDEHPFIHRLLLWDKSRKYRDFFRLLREVRRGHYDLLITIQRFAMTGILTMFSGAKTTNGFDKNPLSRFFTKRIHHEIGPGIHETDRNQKLIVDLTDSQPAKPKLYAPPLGPLPNKGGENRKSKIKNLKSEFENQKSEIYYTISPASLWFTKQLPAEKWLELIREMPEEATVYLLGSKSDIDLCEKITHDPVIQSSSDPVIVNLAGQLTLLQSAALMKGARMNFTNDSAPLHLASAVNALVTVVYCSTTPDFGFGPLSDDAAIIEIREQLSCRPCGLHGRTSCPEHHFRCATGIDPGVLRSRL
ncbi:MAG: glycosyltransferase family 9 protein [Bacteroidales bacterium]|nr:glycosyltransferase family 9 protein [Bacteroidales bacterium]